MKKRCKIEDSVLERLIHDYGNDVLRLSYMYLKDIHLAEDAFQEVFIKVCNKWDSFRNEASEKTWIIKITINVCKDMLRNNWLKKVDFYDLEAVYNISDSVNQVEAEIDKRILFEQVLMLPDKYKEVILLYYYQGFSTGEIAEILDSTTGTVGSQLSRGRALLKNGCEVFFND